MLPVRHPVRVPALQQHQPEQEQPEVGLPRRSDRACGARRRGSTVTTATKMPKTTQRREPPPAQPRRDREHARRPGRAGPACDVAAAGVVAAGRAEFGQRGQSGHRRIPPSRAGCPSATMRLPSTQATVPSPGQVESPTSHSPRPPRSCGIGELVGVARRLAHTADRAVAGGSAKRSYVRGVPTSHDDRPLAQRRVDPAGQRDQPLADLLLALGVLAVVEPGPARRARCASRSSRRRWPAGALTVSPGRGDGDEHVVARRRAAGRSPAAADGG